MISFIKNLDDDDFRARVKKRWAYGKGARDARYAPSTVSGPYLCFIYYIIYYIYKYVYKHF